MKFMRNFIDKNEKLSKVLVFNDNGLIKLSLSNNYFKYEGLLRHDLINLDYIINEAHCQLCYILFCGFILLYFI